MRLMKLTFMLWSIVMAAATAYADDIKIHVSGIEPARGGTLYVMLFAKDGYPKKHAKAIEKQKVPADKTEMDFTFTTDRDDVAIKVHHDEDGNGKVTKNWTGIYPAEGLGFSQGQRLKMTGAPSYRKSKIMREGFSTLVEIDLRYSKKKKS